MCNIHSCVFMTHLWGCHLALNVAFTREDFSRSRCSHAPGACLGKCAFFNCQLYILEQQILVGSSPFAGSAWGDADKFGEFAASGFIFKDTVDVIAFEDPEVSLEATVRVYHGGVECTAKMFGNTSVPLWYGM
jgi:hypothetical protein